MKCYSDYSNEITSSEIYEGLLGYGLFSEKLPPIFSSEQFYDYCIKKDPVFQDNWKPYIYYDSMRNTNVPRQLGIPTPIAYKHLCECIKDNWAEIQKHFADKTKGQKYKLSRIHIRKLKDNKALFKMNYDKWQIDGTPETDLLIGKRFVVCADISTCFASIYSHSIPWALVGKDVAKAHAGKPCAKEWYNRIDHFTQNCKNGETHGLIIGPHASNLLSEIILTCVDYELFGKWDYVRNIDDYKCFVKTYEDAQLFLTELSAALRKYDLTLNYKKTTISALPIALTEQWVRKISNPTIYIKDGILDYLGTRAYLDGVIEVMRSNENNSAILNYAIKTLPIDKMSRNAKELSVKTILHLTLIYPYLLQILDENVFEKFGVPKNLIKSFAEQVYKQELKNKNYDGVCYALFFALKYGFIIDSVLAKDAIDSDSCIFRLMALLYFKMNGIKTEENLMNKLALKLRNNDTDLNQNWVFVFEALSQSDLAGDWKNLKTSGISFLKPEYQY